MSWIGQATTKPARLIAMTAMAALASGWFFVLGPTSVGGPAGYVIVKGTSMEPTLQTDDLVITQRQDRYTVGDIVLFEVDDALVIHRIVGGDPMTGFTVRGDNQPVEDGFQATPATIVGKAWLRLPGFGWWVALVRQPLPLAIATWGLVTYLLLRRWARQRPKMATEG